MAESTQSTELARLIDHTLLKGEATRREIETLCAEARAHGFHSVVVTGSRVALAYALLEDTDVKVLTVVGLPFGAGDGDVKRFETEVAVDNGAHELEVALNIGFLREGEDRRVLRELRDVVEAAEERPVGAVVEAGLLTQEEMARACRLAEEAGVQWVSTGAGLGPSRTTVDDIRLLRATLGPKVGVKAAGNVAGALTALAFLEAGATRLAPLDSVTLVRSAEFQQ